MPTTEGWLPRVGQAEAPHQGLRQHQPLVKVEGTPRRRLVRVVRVLPRRRIIHPTECICSTTISRPVPTAEQGVIGVPLPLCGGVMQEAEYELRRIPLPRTRVNKGLLVC